MNPDAKNCLEAISQTYFPNYIAENEMSTFFAQGEGQLATNPFEGGAGMVLLLFPKTKGVDEEVRGRLSGHGFSTERREERGRMRSEVPRWGTERADESIP
jgi:hypothetical protein